jgi:hypothetical protein
VLVLVFFPFANKIKPFCKKCNNGRGGWRRPKIIISRVLKRKQPLAKNAISNKEIAS